MFHSSTYDENYPMFSNLHPTDPYPNNWHNPYAWGNSSKKIVQILNHPLLPFLLTENPSSQIPTWTPHPKIHTLEPTKRLLSTSEMRARREKGLCYKDEIEKIVQELLANGTIRRSQSPCASPILLVRKKGGSWRMCVDYRYLNTFTIKHNYPIPVINVPNLVSMF